MNNCRVCPTCEGKGQVSPELYDTTPDYLKPLRYEGVVECLTCHGHGIQNLTDESAPIMMLGAGSAGAAPAYGDSSYEALMDSNLISNQDKLSMLGGLAREYVTTAPGSRYEKRGVFRGARTRATVVEENPFVPGMNNPDGQDDYLHMDRFSNSSPLVMRGASGGNLKGYMATNINRRLYNG